METFSLRRSIKQLCCLVYQFHTNEITAKNIIIEKTIPSLAAAYGRTEDKSGKLRAGERREEQEMMWLLLQIFMSSTNIAIQMVLAVFLPTSFYWLERFKSKILAIKCTVGLPAGIYRQGLLPVGVALILYIGR